MNRKILFQVSAPAVLIGLLLSGACLFGVWYLEKVQTDMARIYSKDVASREATIELATYVKDLRHHSLRYLIDPTPRSGRTHLPAEGMAALASAPAGVPLGSLTQTAVAVRSAMKLEWLELIDRDQQRFETALVKVKHSAPSDPETDKLIGVIETEYRNYQEELAQSRSKYTSASQGPDLSSLAEYHPVHRVIEPCQQLAGKNEEIMEKTRQANERSRKWVRVAMILLGITGPVGGLIMGFGIARGLSRSIHQLSVQHQRELLRRTTGHRWTACRQRGSRDSQPARWHKDARGSSHENSKHETAFPRGPSGHPRRDRQTGTDCPKLSLFRQITDTST